MSTNAIIAEVTGNFNWQGRYCHWDGYPESLGKELWAIVKRDGVQMASETLLHDHTYWSTIDVDQGDLAEDGNVAVIGYGKANNTQVMQGEWIESDPKKDKWGTEWIYILDEHAMQVGRVQLGKVTLDPHWSFPWDDPEPDWAQVQKEGYE